MKHITGIWLKRLWTLIAVKLIIIAVLLTIARFAITSIDDYKEQFVEWVAAKYDINVNAEEVSAGIDFSGIVLTLKNVDFADSEALPFELKIENLFLHFDFLDSLRNRTIVFNDISLKGGDLLIKPLSQSVESPGPELPTESDITLDALKNILLLRLSSFSITDSKVTFADTLYNEKSISIKDLSWVNAGERHQGVGKASLPDTLGESSLEFLIDIKGDAEGSNDQLIGSLYAHAENLNATEYLAPQVNVLAELKKATVSFKIWGAFDLNGPKSIQFEWGNSEIAWSLLGQDHDWQINDGLLQFTFNDKDWLFDSYDLNITHNYVPASDVKITGNGVLGETAEFDLNGVNINAIVPFALLFSTLEQDNLDQVSALQMGGDVKKIALQSASPGSMPLSNKLNTSIDIQGFNTQAAGIFPGISSADIAIVAGQNAGHARVTLGPQEVSFNGQFDRAMPVQKADFNMSWTQDDTGLQLSSDKSILVTDDLESLTQFSLFLPVSSEQDSSPFLSLYSTVSLNDAAKAQHYFPIEAMGQDVYNYLQPTLKKGSITDAKILWNGRFADYPFENNEGVFQALVPVKDAQYDFYEQWQGLSDLDLTLLFENDYLLMESDKAKLGDINVAKLSANIDHLTEDGILTIDADVNENAQSIAKYLIASPLKDSVGKALQTIKIKNNVQGNLNLRIPLAEKNGETVAKGQLKLSDNNIDIDLGSGSILPLKKVKGSFTFTNGNLQAKGLTAALFDQAVNVSFESEEDKDKFKLNGALSGNWDLSKLSTYHRSLLPLRLSGNLDWLGQINFAQNTGQDYQFGLQLDSKLQGVNVNLPAPFNKNTLQAWPTSINVNSNPQSTRWNALINNKLKSVGEINHSNEQSQVQYLYLGLGQDAGIDIDIDRTKQVIRVNEAQVNLTPWVSILKSVLSEQTELSEITAKAIDSSLFNIDDIYLDVKHAALFDQPLVNVHSKMSMSDKQWLLDVNSDQLTGEIEYRQGMPDRFDINIKKMNMQSLDISAIETLFADDQNSLFALPSTNLRKDYSEMFVECTLCIYKEMDLSSLKLHVFPTQTRYNINYLTLGDEDQKTTLSGVWDQQRTNVILESNGNSENSIVQRLGYNSPMNYDSAGLNAALNWVGAPWQFNLDSLNGTLSMHAEDGQITEVDDKGARLLSFLSLSGIRRSLNLEFGNVFSKGLGFDKMSLSAVITNGILKNDDYFLDGSAGKVSGSGLIDLPNLNVNYLFSYSPAVTSSLPVLAAFAINPLTGAAVLMLTKILEPVVDSIIRVDFSVKGALSDPDVKIEDSQKGTVRLENSNVLDDIQEQQKTAK